MAVSFRSYISWKLVTTQIIAALCMIVSSHDLSLLYKLRERELLMQFGRYNGSESFSDNNARETIRELIFAPAIAVSAGWIISFIICILICRRRKLKWQNGLIAMFIVFLLYRADLTNTAIIWILGLPSTLLNLFDMGPRPMLITSAAVLLLLSLYIFFSPRVYKFSKADILNE